MDNNSLVKMPLPLDPGAVKLIISGKRYLLRVPQQSDSTASRQASVIAINAPPPNGQEDRLAAAAAELHPTPGDNHVPNEPPATGLTPDDLPSVNKGIDLDFNSELLRR